MKHLGVLQLPVVDAEGKVIKPLIVKQEYTIRYLHSFAQDSSFFLALRNKELIGTRCPECHYGFTTFKAHCMFCGTACQTEKLPSTGRIHSFTVCHFGSEAFLAETPFILVLVEFPGFNTLFLSRLKLPESLNPETADLIGRAVKAKFRKYQNEEPRYDTSDVWFVLAQ